MKIARITLGLTLACTALAARADDPPPDPKAAAELERLIHKAVVADLPKVIEDASGWGHTAPLPEKLRLKKAKRTLVKVGDRVEAPNGLWRKVRVWLDDPQRDLTVRVLGLKQLDATSYRLTAEADVALRSETDAQQWANGLLLLNVTARADAALTVRVECDIAAKLDPKKLKLALEPTVKRVSLDLREFTLKDVTFRRAGITVGGDAVTGVGEEFKGALQVFLRSAEPGAARQATEAVARTFREGKGPLTPAAVLKAAAPLLKAKNGAGEK